MITRTAAAIACLLALLPGPAAAQGIGGGVKAGVSLGDIPNITNEAEGIDELNATSSLRTGYAWGGFLTFNFGNGFMLQPEVLYTQKGVKLKADASGQTATYRVKVDYVDIPILARLTFGKVVRGYVFGGPSMNFNVSAKSVSGFLDESKEEDISDEVESFEFAVAFGGGIELGPVLVEGRWSEGITNIAKVPAGDTGPDNLKTRTFLVLFGLRF